ncbi:MAG: hypothetical protein ACOY5R_19075 [Pseudomonadota bacterium]|uniref:hypothetical protein n=1 Tax=Rhizorhabdus phycosphaerae TaxID=2711156 RepID=UPI0013ED897D|nr:hypothetical protein [Rhizorhabdus phycosphaerae]
MSSEPGLDSAREAAARHLEQGGYSAEAALVRAGAGDDFAEVRIARALLTILSGDAAGATRSDTAARRNRNGHRLGGEEC